jgi:hypothetical protein
MVPNFRITLRLPLSGRLQARHFEWRKEIGRFVYVIIFLGKGNQDT